MGKGGPRVDFGLLYCYTVYTHSEQDSTSGAESPPSPDKRPKEKTTADLYAFKKITVTSVHKKCPTAGCDGRGHVTKRFDMHHTVSGCPMYHSMTPEERKVRNSVAVAVPLVMIGTLANEDGNADVGRQEIHFFIILIFY